MTLNILRLPRLIAERRSTATLGMLIIGMLWAGIAFRHFNGLEADLQLHAIATLLTFIILAAMERMLRAEARAHQKAEQLRLTLEHMNQGIMLVTPDQQIPIINRRCVELLDLPPQMIESPPRFDELTNEVAKIYATHFTEPELKELLAFYKTPVGVKLIAEQPKVGEEGIKFAQDWANGLTDQVIAKMREELKKRGHAL